MLGSNMGFSSFSEHSVPQKLCSHIRLFTGSTGEGHSRPGARSNVGQGSCFSHTGQFYTDD